MPRRVVRSPGHDRSRSLGWLAVAWMEFFVVHGPGDVQGEPVRHGDELTEFLVDCYALGDADTNNHLLYDSAFFSRPKGCDKSGLGARLALYEALGPCRFVGWAEGGEMYRDPWGLGFEYTYEPGEPMGQPVRTPYIRCMATEEGQTGNVYDSVYFNLTEGPLADAMARRDDAGLTRVLLPGGGEITPSTASSASKDGGKETFVVFDETHLYNQPQLRQMYKTVTRNLRKRKRIAGTWFLETTTMFAPGEESVAQATYELAKRIEEGRARVARLLFDHRWGECENLADEPSLRAGIADAYGEAMAWNDLDGLVNEFYEARSDPADSRRYFLNAPTETADAWVAHREWAPRYDPDKVLADRDAVTLGFDGSRGRARGVADATALVGMRVRDGFAFEVGVWESDGSQDWSPSEHEVDAAVHAAFDRFTVVGFYADPTMWDEHVAKWQAKYAARLKVRATATNPVRWPKSQLSRVCASLKSLHDAILQGEVTHDGSSTLTRHVLNARRRVSRSGVFIAKEHPQSARKVDAAYALMLAWQARLDAIAAGVGDSKQASVIRRVR